MVITVWYTKYKNRPEFLSSFETEQEYIDAMFILIIFQNFGTLIESKNLATSRLEAA